MRYEARLTAYDMLDIVNWSVSLEMTNVHPPERRFLLVQGGHMQGTGEEDPRKWLRDVLMDVVESI